MARVSMLLALGLFSATMAVPVAQVPAAQPAAEITFTKHIAPILQRSCIACHSQKSDKPAGKLVLDDDRLVEGPRWDLGNAGPVPGPCAIRVTVPSSTFQSTSASISRNSPANFSAFIQLRMSPKATGLRSTVIVCPSLQIVRPQIFRQGARSR